MFIRTIAIVSAVTSMTLCTPEVQATDSNSIIELQDLKTGGVVSASVDSTKEFPGSGHILGGNPKVNKLTGEDESFYDKATSAVSPILWKGAEYTGKALSFLGEKAFNGGVKTASAIAASYYLTPVIAESLAWGAGAATTALTANPIAGYAAKVAVGGLAYSSMAPALAGAIGWNTPDMAKTAASYAPSLASHVSGAATSLYNWAWGS